MPGVLAAVTTSCRRWGQHRRQQLATTRDINYLVMDVNRELVGRGAQPISAADERAHAYPVLT
ncbi:MAG: hypothetical protein R2708_28320 [Vicinamibacterales bacterium]